MFKGNYNTADIMSMGTVFESNTQVISCLFFIKYERFYENIFKKGKVTWNDTKLMISHF